MGCAASVQSAELDARVEGGGREGSAFGWREQIWADTYAPGRVPIGRTAEFMRSLPGWLPCRPVREPTEEQLLKLKAALAQEWNGKQRPETLRVGGRARSYVTNYPIAVRNTKEIVQLFDPDEENHEILTHAGGLSPRDTFERGAAQQLPGNVQPRAAALVCAPRLMVTCPPANKTFKPKYGALPSTVVKNTVDSIVGTL